VDDYQLLIDLHLPNPRQGPGGETETLRALELCRVDQDAPFKIADIGCGTGASTLLIAQHLNAQITAVDFLPEFLDALTARAAQAGLGEQISTIAGSMEDLPFADEEFDLIWSEGAIYNIGFEKGVKEWRRYLKPGGLLAASEITWLTDSRPAEIQSHWDCEYPEIASASAKIKALEKNGYSPIGYFILPANCWLENYYRPLQAGFEAFLERNGAGEKAHRIVEAEREEIELYKKYQEYYSYGFYIARR
jgi:SAM-dependent methyltransferase